MSPSSRLPSLADRGGAAAMEVDIARRDDLRVHSLEDPFDWVRSGTVDIVLSRWPNHYLTNRTGSLREAHRMPHAGDRLSSARTIRLLTDVASAAPPSA